MQTAQTTPLLKEKEYIPIKLACLTYEPINGTDVTLSPIILLHGLITTKEIWKDISQIFANSTRRKVYAYDCRNVGDSQYTDDFNFDLSSQDLCYFMDSKNISKAILIGHSMGGYTVSRVALKYPDRVEMAVIVDMFIPQFTQKVLDATLDHARVWDKVVKNVTPNVSREEATRQMVDEVYKHIPQDKQMFFTPKELLYNCDFNLKQNSDGSYALRWRLDSFINAAKDINTFSKPPQGIYHGPVLYIYGGSSLFNLAKEEEHVRKHFPNVEMMKIKGATHNVHVDKPEIFTEGVLKFIYKNQSLSNHL